MQLAGILISDIGMPEMDGYELIRRVRQQGSDGTRAIPAIAMTAFTRPNDRDRALKAGFQAHLAKPVDPATLVATVARLCGGRDGVNGDEHITERHGDLHGAD